MNTQAVGTSPAPINGTTFASALDKAKELGAQAGKGKDTQIKFYIMLTETAYHSQIDLDANKHGTGVDDATKLVEAYTKAQSGATVFDAKAPNQRKAISCGRTAIKYGMWPKGGTGEPLSTMNNFLTMRQKLRADPANAKKLDDAANAFLRMARTQIKRDQVLNDPELRQFCFKSDPSLATVEDILVSIRKQATALRDGKAAHNTALDNSSEVSSIIQACTKRLTAIAQKRAGVTSVAVNKV